MYTIAIIVFWLSVGLMFHSYVLYPLLLQLFSSGKKENDITYAPDDIDLPRMSVVFSVYNEEKVLREKLQSIIDTNYPLEKLRLFIGSDNSSDGSNAILKEFLDKYPQLTAVFMAFTDRGGKSTVLNKMVNFMSVQPFAPDDILILTDANVMFIPDTLYQLARHFKNPAIGQVSATILNRGIKADGISKQETAYISRENTIKYLEGLNWGSMVGAFGACYAMRATYWTYIPQNFLMEDFYLSMRVLQQGGKCICEPKAICYEDVSNEIEEEYKRKARIQAGNFQNLAVYWPLLFRFNAVSFTFFSHKVIRWLGPVFILLAFVANLALLPHPFYLFTMLFQVFLLFSPFLDTVLKRIGIHLVLLRFAAYFYLMNLALVKGFMMYMRGIKTNAWSPTKRNI